MAFTVSDFNDLKQLLADHPAWRIELRQMLLSEDFEALPGIVRQLGETVRQLGETVRQLGETVQQLGETVRQLGETVRELVEAQRRSEERLTRLEEIVTQLAEAQRRSEERLSNVEVRLDRVEVRLDRVEVRLGQVRGDTLELLYQKKAPAHFGRWLRGTRVIGSSDLADLVEGKLDEAQFQDVLLTDLVIRGRLRGRVEMPDVWLAVEISAVIDRKDVERAVRRAELMRRAGLPTLPVVAGEETTQGAETEARRLGVAMIQDGSTELWDEAIAAWPL